MDWLRASVDCAVNLRNQPLYMLACGVVGGPGRLPDSVLQRLVAEGEFLEILQLLVFWSRHVGLMA
jgi:hypothetical protein